MTGWFDRFLPVILAEEGDFADNPEDPGGATMQGITQRVYDRFRDVYGRIRRGVAGMEPLERDWIYHHWYFDECAAGALLDLGHVATALQAFDAAVNEGPLTARQLLQQCVFRDPGAIDGIVGAETRAALARFTVPELAELYCVARTGFYRGRRKPEFLDDWLRRSYRVHEKGTELAAHQQESA